MDGPPALPYSEPVFLSDEECSILEQHEDRSIREIGGNLTGLREEEKRGLVTGPF
jgi:hypothetical protein